MVQGPCASWYNGFKDLVHLLVRQLKVLGLPTIYLGSWLRIYRVVVWCPDSYFTPISSPDTPFSISLSSNWEFLFRVLGMPLSLSKSLVGRESSRYVLNFF